MREGASHSDRGLQLFRQYQSGDELAFEELLKLFQNSLTQYIYGFVGDADDAEELMNAAFAELAADTKFRGESSLKTYLFAIGRHLALRHIKKSGHGLHVPFEHILSVSGGEHSLLEEDYIRAERQAWLDKAIRSLKQEYREVLYLAYFDNMSRAEIAKTMGKKEKQIANLMYRAKVAIREKLGGEAEMYL